MLSVRHYRPCITWTCQHVRVVWHLFTSPCRTCLNLRVPVLFVMCPRCFLPFLHPIPVGGQWYVWLRPHFGSQTLIPLLCPPFCPVPRFELASTADLHDRHNKDLACVYSNYVRTPMAFSAASGEFVTVPSPPLIPCPVCGILQTFRTDGTFEIAYSGNPVSLV